MAHSMEFRLDPGSADHEVEVSVGLGGESVFSTKLSKDNSTRIFKPEINREIWYSLTIDSKGISSVFHSQNMAPTQYYSVWDGPLIINIKCLSEQWSVTPGNVPDRYRQLGSGRHWANTAAMTATYSSSFQKERFTWDRNLYIVQDDRLWRVDPNNGDYTQLGSGRHWADTAAMTALDSFEGWKLYVIQKDQLWRVNPVDGSYAKVEIGPGNFAKTAAMAAPRGNSNSRFFLLFVIQNNQLWEVDVVTSENINDATRRKLLEKRVERGGGGNYTLRQPTGRKPQQ